MERLEGKQSILAALAARQRKIEVLLVSPNAHWANVGTVLNLARLQGIPIKTVSPEELDAAARGKTHGGLVAICTVKPLTPLSELLQIIKGNRPHPFLVLLEGVEDEQNLGFIIRSAAAMGVKAVLLKKHIWNFDPLVVSRTSAGAYELLPLVKVEKSDEILTQLQKKGIKIYGALAGAKKTMYEIDFTAPLMVALGGEKRGLSAAVRSLCNGFFTIPMPARQSPAATLQQFYRPASGRSPDESTEYNIESFSLSHSAAIIMAEVMRQRYIKNKSEA
jgi:23S rRNA (guanosine2251-2'-O)-methyltransferase